MASNPNTANPFTRLNLAATVDPTVRAAVEDLYDKLATVFNTPPAITSLQSDTDNLQAQIDALANKSSGNVGGESSDSTTTAGKTQGGASKSIPAFSIQGALGLAANPQYAWLPQFLLSTFPSNNPTQGAPYAQPGLLTSLSSNPNLPGAIYRYSGPPSYDWEGPLLGGIIANTHAVRSLDYPAAPYKLCLYFETDRRILYQSNGTSWIYVAGSYEAAIASRPILVAADAGFIFIATDWTVTYYWDGSHWNYVSGTYSAAFSSRPSTLGANDVGFLFNATNQTVTWRWDGSHWNYISGVYSSTFSNRPSTLGANDVGYLFVATDDKAEYYWSGSVWILLTNLNFNQQTVSYGILATDFMVLGVVTAAKIFTLLDLTTVPNQIFVLKNDATSTHNITIDTTSSQTIDNNASAHYVLAPGDSLTVESPGTGTDWKILDHFIAAGGGSSTVPIFPISTQTSNYQILITDFCILDSSGGITVTLPDATTCSGQLFAVKNEGTGITTLAAFTAQTVDGFFTYSINPLCGVLVQSDGSNFWIVADIIQPLSASIEYASNNLTLITSDPTLIPGCSITLPVAGAYLVIGVFTFDVATLDAGNTMIGELSVGGTPVTGYALLTGAAGAQVSVMQQWIAPVSAGTTLELLGSKTGGTGTSVAVSPHCSISALLVHP